LKKRQRNWLKSSYHIKVVNTLIMKSTTLVEIMGLKGNLIKFTLLKKMLSLKGLE
jgi:hypothetical protein